MGKATVTSVINAVGADRIAGRLGVSHHSLRKARELGEFTGNWYGPLSDLCKEVGAECPKSLFKWKSPLVKPKGSLACNEAKYTRDAGKFLARQKCISGGEK